MSPTVLGEKSDIDLLDRFVHERSEAAFAAIVRATVGGSRASAADRASTEDADPATFLVLASQAASLHPGTTLSDWSKRISNNFIKLLT